LARPPLPNATAAQCSQLLRSVNFVARSYAALEDTSSIYVELEHHRGLKTEQHYQQKQFMLHDGYIPDQHPSQERSSRFLQNSQRGGGEEHGDKAAGGLHHFDQVSERVGRGMARTAAGGVFPGFLAPPRAGAHNTTSPSARGRHVRPARGLPAATGCARPGVGAPC
jgi:hypothetical protein